MPTPRGISTRSSRIVTAHAALAGLCPLIPVPFVDDLALRRVARRMYRALFAAHGLTLPKRGARLLTAAPSHRLRDAFTAVALYPVKKIVRKVVYVLAVKDCAEVASALFHDGWLLAHALEHLPADTSPEDPATLRRVREAMLKTYADIDPAPLRRALVGAFRGAHVSVRHSLQAARRWLRDHDADADNGDTPEPAPPEGVKKLTASVRAAAMGEWQYMDALVDTFRRHLGLPEAPREHAASTTAAPRL